MVSNQQIVGKTNPFNGERAFVLCSLEQLIGLLSFTTINDQMIIQHTKNLLRSSNGIHEYQTFLNCMSPSQSVTERALALPKLTTSERQIINELLKYSLQGTTQGRYLTGGVPPVRFSM